MCEESKVKNQKTVRSPVIDIRVSGIAIDMVIRRAQTQHITTWSRMSFFSNETWAGCLTAMSVGRSHELVERGMAAQHEMARAPRASPQIFDSTDGRNKLLSRAAGTEIDRQQDGSKAQFCVSG